LNSFTCRTSRQGSKKLHAAGLAGEVLHLPDKPAGVKSTRWC
jgi:hypothetical protein